MKHNSFTRVSFFSTHAFSTDAVHIVGFLFVLRCVHVTVTI